MNRYQKLRAASMFFGLVLAGSALAAESTRTSQSSDQSRNPAKSQISGTVESFNIDPRGTVNGIMLKEGDHVSQLNFPPDQGAAITAAATIGEKVEASGMIARADGDHPIYRLLSLTAPDGKQVTIAGPEDGTPAHIEGTVKHLNYSPRGDVDGAILDSGDFLQLGPGGAADTGLAIGQKINADGNSRPMPSGHNIINATSVNGTPISRPPRRPGPGGPGGPEDHGPGGGPQGPLNGPPPSDAGN